MAAKRRHWKEKNERFWARISIPAELRPLFGNKTQLTEPLGGDLRIADQEHAAAVARLNLLDWRDSLEASGKSAKTIRDKYLAFVRAALRWATKERRLPNNEMADVQQEAPKKVRTRESGFTTPEAERILKASLTYRPAEAANPANRESPHLTAAKRWMPLLCAFTGARIDETAAHRSGFP